MYLWSMADKLDYSALETDPDKESKVSRKRGDDLSYSFGPWARNCCNLLDSVPAKPSFCFNPIRKVISSFPTSSTFLGPPGYIEEVQAKESDECGRGSPDGADGGDQWVATGEGHVDIAACFSPTPLHDQQRRGCCCLLWEAVCVLLWADGSLVAPHPGRLCPPQGSWGR